MEKHTRVRNIQGTYNACLAVNDKYFKNLTQLGSDLYECEFAPRRVDFFLPAFIGLQILNLAKLKLVSFVYDFIHKYVSRSSFGVLLCDTDSVYLSLSGRTFLDSVLPQYHDEVKAQIYGSCGPKRHPDAVLTRDCCDQHRAEDKFAVGLWKREWSGQKLVALCSKTYVSEDETGNVKLSCKGVNKVLVLRDHPMQVFQNVLKDQKMRSSVNHGFRACGGDMYTYTQVKSAFPYVYLKRQVLENGVYTIPLPKVINPKVKSYTCLQLDIPILSPDQIHSFNVDGRVFSSVRQAFVSLKVLHHQPSNTDLQTMVMSHHNAQVLEQVARSIPDDSIWIKLKFEKMKQIVQARIDQLPAAKAALIHTGETKLVHSCIYDDKYFSTGTDPLTTRWCKEGDLCGSNYLGKIYMRIREKFT